MRPSTWFPSALLLLWGCDNPAGLPNLTLGPGLTEVYAHHTSGLRSPTRRVITDEASWEALWDSIQSPFHPPAPRPTVDCSAVRLIVAGMGDRPNGGYLIHIDRFLDLGDGSGAVFVTSYQAGSGCATAQMFTQSVHIVAAPLTPSMVSFREHHHTYDCG